MATNQLLKWKPGRKICFIGEVHYYLRRYCTLFSAILRCISDYALCFYGMQRERVFKIVVLGIV